MARIRQRHADYDKRRIGCMVVWRQPRKQLCIHPFGFNGSTLTLRCTWQPHLHQYLWDWILTTNAHVDWVEESDAMYDTALVAYHTAMHTFVERRMDLIETY